MKARVKETGEIVDVQECAVDMYLEEIGEMIGRVFHITELDFDNLDYPDYWTRLEHQYAGMAMRGILSNPELFKATAKNAEEFGLIVPQAVTIDAYHFAHALVEKLKEKEERK